MIHLSGLSSKLFHSFTDSQHVHALPPSAAATAPIKTIIVKPKAKQEETQVKVKQKEGENNNRRRKMIQVGLPHQKAQSARNQL